MSAGELLAQGMQNFGQGIANYRQLQQADAAASGQINAFLSQGPQAIAMLSPDGQDLVQKQLQGNLKYKDRLQLVGEIQTSMAMRQQMQELAIKNIQLQKWKMMQDMLNQAVGAQPEIPQTGNTPMSAPTPPPAGSGPLLQGALNGQGPGDVVKNYIQPPRPVSITDPQIQALLPKVLPMAGFDMEKATDVLQKRVDAINDQQKAQYAAVAGAEKPTGNLYFKSVKYKDGLPVSDVYSPEIVKGRGTASESTMEGPQEIEVPHGGTPPGPVIFRGSKGTDNTAAGAGYNTNDPQWQKDVQEAYMNASQSTVAVANAKLLQDAARAYTSGNTNQINAIFGDPHFAKYRQLFTGNNPLSALQTALAANTQSILAQVRSPSGGTIGGRLLQTEFENTAKVLGEGTMTNEAILAAADNVFALNERMNAINKAYATYRETMPSGDASAMAIKQFGAPPVLRTVPGKTTMVRVRMPDGRTGSIPSDNLEKALAAGATKL